MRIYEKNSHFVNQEGVLIKKYISNITTHRHSHDFIEIVYVLRGSGIHEINDVTYTILPGCFYVVDSGEIHNLNFHETSEYFNLFIKEDFLQELILFSEGNEIDALALLRNRKRADHSVRFSGEKNDLIHLLFSNFYSELHRAEHPTRPLIRHYLSLILLEYAAALSQQQNAREPDLVLPRVVDYIHLHYKENLQVERIAEAYRYNPVYFGRLFQRYYGQSLKSYVTELRLTCAGELLETTDYTIEEVALQSGFGNKLQFYKKFKERFGYTPKEYKTRLRLQDNRLALTLPPTCQETEELPQLTPFRFREQEEADRKLYEFTAKDRSMIGAGIFPGDRVVVEVNDHPESGALVAVRDQDGGVTARRISVLTGEKNYILHACTEESQSYPDLYVSDPKLLGIIRLVLHDPKNDRKFS